MGRRNIESAAKIRLALNKEGIRSRQAEIRMKSGGYDYKGSVKHPSADLRGSSGKATEFIAQDAGVSARSVELFKYIEKNAPNLADDLCSGKKVNNKKLSIGGVYRDLRKEERQLGLKATEFPNGKYRVIYADPPCYPSVTHHGGRRWSLDYQHLGTALIPRFVFFLLPLSLLI
jgi:hypothetical protein